jgi:competence protein ComGF
VTLLVTIQVEGFHMATSAKERQQKHRERLRNQGKKQLLVTLEPKAFKALDRICKKNGFTHNQGINDTLLQAVAGVKARETDKQIKARIKAEMDLKKVEAEKLKLEKELAETLVAMEKMGKKLTVMKPGEDGVYKPDAV